MKTLDPRSQGTEGLIYAVNSCELQLYLCSYLCTKVTKGKKLSILKLGVAIDCPVIRKSTLSSQSSLFGNKMTDQWTEPISKEQNRFFWLCSIDRRKEKGEYDKRCRILQWFVPTAMKGPSEDVDHNVQAKCTENCCFVTTVSNFLSNRQCSIYINIPTWLSGQTTIFGVAFLVSKSLLRMERQKKVNYNFDPKASENGLFIHLTSLPWERLDLN